MTASASIPAHDGPKAGSWTSNGELIPLVLQLEADILSRVGKPAVLRCPLPGDLESRRLELLARHLGFAPASPLPLLHVLGDSHTAFFAGAEGLNFHPGRRVLTGFFRVRRVSIFTELLPVFRVFHLGASTAWSADSPRSSSQTREKIEALLRRDVPRGGSVLLVFGEIDCRFHLPRAVLAGKPIQDAVAETIGRFMSLPRRLAELGFDVTVWQPSGVTVGAPTPPGDNQPLPIVGPQELRLDVTRAYCEHLSMACSKEGIRCAGIAGKYHPWSRPAVAECFLDGCHLSQRLMPLALRALMEAGALRLCRPADGTSQLAG
jgi:hypothetical protein